jgi:16S rRNA (cytosine967-C5)-methyltransferase
LRESTRLEELANTSKVSALSHPQWLINSIDQDWGGLSESIFRNNNLAPPMSLRVNLARTSRQAYLQQLNLQDIKATTVDFCPSAVILEKPMAVQMLPGFAEGLVSVQDVAAQLAAFLLNARAGERVLDVCAAPGGKSAHILELQPALKELLAVDIDEQRMLRVSDNLQRLQLNASLLTGDATKATDWWDGIPFDRILVDAPCSATGVIRRHPDIKLLRRSEDILSLQHMQQSILDAVWPLLIQGGTLLYASCSVLKIENEHTIQSFLTENKNALEVPIEAGWGQSCAAGTQILTGESNMDGFYYALLQKR